MPDIITYAIPGFVLLIMLEVFLSHRMQRDNYVLADAASSISMGLGSQVIGIVTKVIVLFAFYLAYEYRVFTFGFGVGIWVVAFFLEDLTYYIFHRTSHGSRFFWASHVIHHSSQKYTLATALRQTWTGELTGTFLFWVWMPLLGFHPIMILTLKAVSLIYQFWIHTELITKLPRWFEFVFNTPSHHRVHHSSDVKYLDMNHAGILIIWDRMFGTFIEEKEKPEYGIRDNIDSHNPIKIAFHEWVSIGKDLQSKTSWSNKIKYVFGPPGWSHDGSRKTTAQLKKDIHLKD